jgi:DNA-binding NarL/FixJ family response regulator
MTGPVPVVPVPVVPVVIVDDHALIASALAVALRAEGVRASVMAPDELVGRLDEPAPSGGLVLLDLDLGDGRDGAALVPRLRRAGWRVLLVTGSADEIRVAMAVAAGAVGRVAKSAPFDQLVRTVVHVAEGRSLLAQDERRRLGDLAASGMRDRADALARFARLTPRERQIADLLAEGRRPAAIAADFVVSVATVRTQIRSILGKLDVGSQLEAAALARSLRHWERPDPPTRPSAP